MQKSAVTSLELIKPATAPDPRPFRYAYNFYTSIRELRKIPSRAEQTVCTLGATSLASRYPRCPCVLLTHHVSRRAVTSAVLGKIEKAQRLPESHRLPSHRILSSTLTTYTMRSLDRRRPGV